MTLAQSPDLRHILQQILRQEQALFEDPESIKYEKIHLQPEQMSTFIARSTGHILSYEQIQWLFQKTEGWLPALSWLVELLKEGPIDHLTSPWDPHHLSQSLQEQSVSYFNRLLQEKIPPQLQADFLTLSLLPKEINSQIIQALVEKETIPDLLKSFQETPCLIQTSTSTWRLHPMLKDFLQRTAREQLPHYEQICHKLIQIYLDQNNPLAAEELLTQLPVELDPQLSPLLFSLGESLVIKGYKEKALTYFGRATLCFGQENDSLGITRSLNAMGALYLELGRNEEAKIIYRQLIPEVSPEQWSETFIPAYLSRTLPKLRIHCLGEFELYRQEEPLNWRKWRRRKSLWILLYLILHPVHRATKEELLDLFWPEDSPEKASNAYHVTIHALRQALAMGLKDEVHYLRVERGSVSLSLELIEFIDVEEFRRLYREGQRHWTEDPQTALTWFQEAKALYRGTLLDGIPYEEWLFPYRESLYNQYQEVLTKLALHYTQQKEENKALNLWQEILQYDPTNEFAVREAMALLHQLNRRNEALSLYKKLVNLLHVELNTVPELQTKSLYQNLKNGRWENGS